MRYRAHTGMGTDWHKDKTVLSSIIWNSDPNDRQKLEFLPENSEESEPPTNQPLVHETNGDRSPAYIFWGAALQEAGYDVQPTAHAVQPVTSEAYRYSMAVFWLLPEMDMSGFETAITMKNRQFEFKIAA